MPELATQRTQRENAVVRLMNQLHAGQRRDLVKALGVPPDPSRISAELWAKFERQAEDQLRAALMLIWLISADNLAAALPGFGVPDEIMRQRAREWASGRAGEIAGRMVDRTRASVATIGDRFPGLQSPSALDRALVPTIGPGRAEVVATTEVTNGFTAGEDDIKRRWEQENAATLLAIWNTQRDEMVCPICRPLHQQPQTRWQQLRPEPAVASGPPAHPNCRCFLSYRVITQGDAQDLPLGESRWNAKGLYLFEHGSHDQSTHGRKGGGSSRKAPRTKKPEAPSRPSKQARDAVEDYTTDRFQQINSQLRNGDASDPIVAGVDDFLEKSPKRPGVTARSFSATPEQAASIESMLKSGEFTDTAFLSTRKIPTITDKAAFANKVTSPGRVVLRVKGTSGVDISLLSLNPGEGEVLYPRSARFKVDKFVKSTNGGLLAELTEIPAT